MYEFWFSVGCFLLASVVVYDLWSEEKKEREEEAERNRWRTIQVEELDND